MPVNSYTATFHDELKYPRGKGIEDEARVLRDMHTEDRGYGKRVLKRVDIFVSGKLDERETYKLFDGATIGPSVVPSRVVLGTPATHTIPAIDVRQPDTMTFHDELKYPRGNSIEDEKRVLRDMHTEDRGYGKRVLKRVDIFVSEKLDERETYKLFDGATIGPSVTPSRVVLGMPATRTFPSLDLRQPETMTLSASDQRTKLMTIKFPSGINKPVKISEEDELAVDILCSMRSSDGSALESAKRKHGSM